MRNTWDDPYDSWKLASPPEYSGHGAPAKRMTYRACPCGSEFVVMRADQARCERDLCPLKGAR